MTSLLTPEVVSATAPRHAGRSRWTDWTCEVSLWVGDDRVLTEAAQVIRDVMAQVEQAASRFRADSEVWALRSGQTTVVSDTLMSILTSSLTASLATDGLIDCTVGQQLVHWGYRTEVPRHSTVVVSPEVFTFRPAISWRDIEINETTRTVRVPSGTLLDFGATAKAWASDVAAERIAQSLGVDVVVGIGGDLAIRCATTDQLPVEVGEVPGGPADVILVGNGGVATSTTVRRQWMTDRGMAHHIVDPRTGQPARSPWRTVSVIAANCQAANHAATAALTMGADAPQWLSDLGLSARLVASDGERHWVGSWGDTVPSRSRQHQGDEAR